MIGSFHIYDAANESNDVTLDNSSNDYTPVHLLAKANRKSSTAFDTLEDVCDPMYYVKHR